MLCKSRTARISGTLKVPIQLDGSKRYAVSLLGWGFKNVFANIYQGIPRKIGWNVTVNTVTTALNYSLPDGIYEVQDVLDILNTYTKMTRYDPLAADDEYFAKFELDLLVGKIKIVPDLTVIAAYDVVCDFDNASPGSLLNSPFINLGYSASKYFDYSVPATLVDIVGLYEPSVSTYNTFLLSSNLTTSQSHVTDPNDPGYLAPTSFLYTSSSAIAAFDLAEYQAFQLLTFEIAPGTSSIGRIEFNMIPDDGSELHIVSGSNVEFTVTVQIVRMD